MQERSDDVISGTKVEATRPFWIVSWFLHLPVVEKGDSDHGRFASLTRPSGNRQKKKMRQVQHYSGRSTPLTGNCCLQGHGRADTPRQIHSIFPHTLHPFLGLRVAAGSGVTTRTGQLEVW